MHLQEVCSRLCFENEDLAYALRVRTSAWLGTVVWLSAVVLASTTLAIFAMHALPVWWIHGSFAMVLAASLVLDTMKRRREAGVVLTLGFWMAATSAVVFLGGAHSPGVFIYLPIVIAAGLFWSWGAAAVLAGASFGMVILAAWLDAIHWLPLPLRPISPTRVVSIFAGSLTMTAVLVGIALHTMQGVLREAQRAAARAEERNERSRRLEAMGLLAGGIAHDFNNLLTVILSLGSVLNREIAADSPARELLVDINASAVRAAALARELLSARSSNPDHVVDVGRALTAFEAVLSRMIGDEKIALSLRLPERPCLVRMQRGSLERIVTNLVLNARDAMVNGGEIVVAVGPPNEVGGAAPMARMVELSVRDTGVGIDPSLQPRIFEPFFTTKGASGTGLGLASVDDIVARLGGCILIDSKPGKGTKFRILLPQVATGDVNP